MGAGGLRILRVVHPALREFSSNLLNIVTPLQERTAGWRHRFARRDGCDGACASNADGLSGHGVHGISHIGTDDGRGLGLVGSTRPVVGYNLPVSRREVCAPRAIRMAKIEIRHRLTAESRKRRCQLSWEHKGSSRTAVQLPATLYDGYAPAPMLTGRDVPPGLVVWGGSGCLPLCSVPVLYHGPRRLHSRERVTKTGGNGIGSALR